MAFLRTRADARLERPLCSYLFRRNFAAKTPAERRLIPGVGINVEAAVIFRIAERVYRQGECLMLPKNSQKYPNIYTLGKSYVTHRLLYQFFVGKIPVGLVLDHQCNTPGCIEPTHLKPCTNKENVLRGKGACAQNARKLHCPKGHPFDKKTTKRRFCSICENEAKRRWAKKNPRLFRIRKRL